VVDNERDRNLFHDIIWIREKNNQLNEQDAKRVLSAYLRVNLLYLRNTFIEAGVAMTSEQAILSLKRH
jgi:hypothetical protein